MKKHKLILAALLTGTCYMAQAQQGGKPEDTEVYKPVPPVVTAGKTMADAPSDAIQLFNGKDLSEWVLTADRSKPADWLVSKGILTVNKSSGNIETKKEFTNYQLHIEWRIPSNITGKGQARGNSGVFLASIVKGDAGYERQL